MTLSDSKRKLVDRILKLFSLGDSSSNGNEAEVHAAVSKARELMARHDLTEADIAAVGSATAKRVAFTITRDVVYTRKGRTFAVYDNNVAHAVNEICGVKTYTSQRQDAKNGWTVSRVFYGTEADVAVANALFHALLDTTRKAARTEYGTGWSPDHQAYAIGFSLRLYHRAVQWRPELALTKGETSALMVVSKDKSDAVARYAADHLQLKERKATPLKIKSVDAYQQGWEDGAHVDLGNPRRRVQS